MATIAEKAIRFRHTDYNPDRAQKLISSSMSRHLSTRNISSKFMHAFLSNLANRQTDTETDRQTGANAFTSSFVGGKYITLSFFCYAPPVGKGAVSFGIVRPSVCPSVSFIANNSITRRPKFGTKVPHL